MATVGFIGRPMVKNLLTAGHKVVAYGRNPKKLEACVAAGAERRGFESFPFVNMCTVRRFLPLLRKMLLGLGSAPRARMRQGSYREKM